MGNKILLFLLINLCSVIYAYSQTRLSLKEALITGRNNNPFYKAEKLSPEIIKNDITTAELKPNPEINVSYSQISCSKYFATNTNFYNTDNFQTVVGISKTFQVKGQREYKIQQAKSNFELSNSNLSDYERNLLADIAGKWVEVWYASLKSDMLKKAKANSDTLLKINNIRLKDQVITTTEFSRTRINDEQYNLMLLSSIQNLKNQVQILSLALGKNDSVYSDEKESLFFESIPESYDSLLSYALKNRTDVLVSRKMIENAQISINLEKANAYPQPQIGLNYSLSNQVPYIGTFLDIPLPFFNRNQGQIAKANIQKLQNDNVYEATILKVKNEIQLAYKDYLFNKQNYEKYKDIYKESENVLNTVKLSYIKQGTTILDYLEAERNWFDIQNQYNEAHYNFIKSYIQLLFVSNLIQTI